MDSGDVVGFSFWKDQYVTVSLFSLDLDFITRGDKEKNDFPLQWFSRESLEQAIDTVEMGRSLEGRANLKSNSNNRGIDLSLFCFQCCQ